MRGIVRRFGAGSAVALAVLVATGVAMASHLQHWQDDTLQRKLALIVLVVVLIGFHAITPRSRVLSLTVLVMSLLIVWLGVDLAH